MSEKLFLGIDLFLLFYFLGLNGFYILLLILTNPVLYQRSKEIQAHNSYRLFSIDTLPPVTIIIPSFNDSKILLSSIQAALNSNFSHLKIIVVDDGSTDDTIQLLTKTYALQSIPYISRPLLQTAPVKTYFVSKSHPSLFVIQKENGGREDSINAGINACTTPFFVNIDSDSIIEPDAISLFFEHLLTKKDLCAMGGTLGILNGCKIENGKITRIRLPPSFWGKMQVIEYLKVFFYGRLGWAQLGGTPLISGGFGIFNKQSIIDIGGFKKVLAGDLDITLTLHKQMREQKKSYEIEYLFDSICWTDVPQTYAALAIQRKRWHCSIFEVCWRFRKMIFNPKYGTVGFIHLPYLFFGEGLGPIVEGFGYVYILLCYIFEVLNFTFLIYLVLIAWGVSIFLTITSLIMQEVYLKKYFNIKQLIIMIGLSIVENIIYRPLTVWWRIQGFFRYFTKKRFIYTRGKRSLS